MSSFRIEKPRPSGSVQEKSTFLNSQQNAETDSFISATPFRNESAFFLPPSIQTKLNVGQPNDKYEKEADSMADQVVNKPEPSILQTKSLASSVTPFIQKMSAEDKSAQQKAKEESQTKLDESEDVQMKCAACGKEETVQRREGEAIQEKLDEENVQTKTEDVESLQMKCEACEKEESVQTKSTQSGKSGSGSSVEKKLKSSKGRGAPMSESLSSEMGNTFGADFSSVRIHTNESAIQMNKSLGAKAFANGKDIYFNRGQYNPDTKEGKHLLAHELTHTIQQGASKKNTEASNSNKSKPIQPKQENKSHVVHAQKESVSHQLSNESMIQKFDLGSAFESLTGIADYLDLKLPDNPIDGVKTLIRALENPYAAPVLSVAMPGYTTILATLKGLLALLELIEYILENKDQIIAEIMLFIEQKLDQVEQVAWDLFKETFGFLDDRHYSAIWNAYMYPMLIHIKDDWQTVIMDALWEQIWPFGGLTTLFEDEINQEGLGRNLNAIWNHFSGMFINVTDLEFSKATDEMMLMQKEIVGLANRFYGWVAIAIIASETVAGGSAGAAAGGVGAAPGAAAGFGSGLATAGTLGEGLLLATIAADVQLILKSIVSLHPVDSMLIDEEKMKENSDYYSRIAESSLSASMLIAMFLLAWLGAEIAQLFLKRLVKFLPESVQELLMHVQRGMSGEGTSPLKEGDPPNIRENPAEIRSEVSQLKEAVKNPENVRSVSDAELATRYDAEVKIGDHTYRRRMSDGSWCRFSTAVCGVKVEGVKADVDAAIDSSAVGTMAPELPTQIQVGEALTVPHKGGQQRVIVEGRYKLEIQGETVEMVELRVLKDTRKGFETGSKRGVTEKQLNEWIEGNEVIRWTEERSRLMKNRPEYREGLVEEVWQNSKSKDGKVYDPNNESLELNWDKSKSRFDQWHMGHKPGHEYAKLVDEYIGGKISYEKFILEYNNPKNYWAEHPLENMGHAHELK